MKPEKKDVPLAEIRIDGGTQPRAEINQEVVADYKSAFEMGAGFPPADVFFDGTNYWLADGFHRYHAANQSNQGTLDCRVHNGTQRDAVLFSVGTNSTHGLKRTNEDKRNAVVKLLNDAEWGKWSAREIAERCNVGHSFVSEIRQTMSTADIVSEVQFKTKTGKTATRPVKPRPTKEETPDVVIPEEQPMTASDPAADRVAQIKVAQKPLKAAGDATGGTAFNPAEFDGTMTDEAAEATPTNVPKHLEDVAASCKLFAGAVVEAGRLKSKIEGLTSGPGGGKLAKYWSDIERCLDQVNVYLKCYRFWSACPECKITDKHTKATKDCKLCGGHGWIPKTNGLSDIHKVWLRERGVKC